MKLIKLIGICALLLGLAIPSMAQCPCHRSSAQYQRIQPQQTQPQQTQYQQTQYQQTQTQMLVDQQGDQVAMMKNISSDDDREKDLRKATEKSEEAAKVFREIMDAPDKGIPDHILQRAEVIAVFPDVFKAGFIVGGTKGSGVVSVRDVSTHQWGAPIFVKLGGGSFGAQIGADSTDLILVGMNRKAADVFYKQEVNLGGELSASAGPVGRSMSAETDVPGFDSEFLSYSRSKGLFVGATIKGVKISQDDDLNQAVYGQENVTTFRPVTEEGLPSGVMTFVNTLNKYSADHTEAVVRGEGDVTLPAGPPDNTMVESSTVDTQPMNQPAPATISPTETAEPTIAPVEATVTTSPEDQTKSAEMKPETKTTETKTIETIKTDKHVRLSKD